MRKSRGFTLIELIMVIVIIGILAAIAVPRFINLSKDANMAACKGSGGALRAAIANFYASAAVHDACGSDNANSSCWPKYCNKTVLGDYVQEWPKSPGAYGQTGEKKLWNDYYSANTGVLHVESACTW